MEACLAALWGAAQAWPSGGPTPARKETLAALHELAGSSLVARLRGWSMARCKSLATDLSSLCAQLGQASAAGV
jgi:hypothetical protein